MKQKYIKPRIELLIVEAELLKAASELSVINDAQDNMSGDVKSDDWGSIWDDSSFDE